MLSGGEHPFKNQSPGRKGENKEAALQAMILEKKVCMPLYFSDEEVDLVSCLLQKDPDQRLGCKVK
jgi:hypothetical protein